MLRITDQHPPLALEEIVAIVNGFKDFTLEEKLAAVSKVADRHPVVNFATKKDGRDFYRVRVSRSGEFPFCYTGVLWNHSSTAQRSRLNIEGDSVLYAANQANAAFAETGVCDDFVIMSLLKIKSDASVVFLPLGAFATVMRSNSAHLDLPEIIVQEIRKKVRACPLNEMQALLISDEFLYNCIMEEDNDYAVSSHTANLLFKKHSHVDVISYPSKKLRSATNYAVKTSSFWEKWEIGSVCTLTAKHLALGHFLHSNVRCVEAIDDRGVMSWQRSYPMSGNKFVPLNWTKPPHL